MFFVRIFKLKFNKNALVKVYKLAFKREREREKEKERRENERMYMTL
jgi:hypothetical protein